MNNDIIKQLVKPILTTVLKIRYTQASSFFVNGMDSYLTKYIKSEKLMVDDKPIKKHYISNFLKACNSYIDRYKNLKKERLQLKSSVVPYLLMISGGGFLIYKAFRAANLKFSKLLKLFNTFREETIFLFNDDNNSHDRIKNWMKRHFDFNFDVYETISNNIKEVPTFLKTFFNYLLNGLDWIFNGDGVFHELFVITAKTAYNTSFQSAFGWIMSLILKRAQLTLKKKLGLKGLAKLGPKKHLEILLRHNLLGRLLYTQHSLYAWSNERYTYNGKLYLLPLELVSKIHEGKKGFRGVDEVLGDSRGKTKDSWGNDYKYEVPTDFTLIGGGFRRVAFKSDDIGTIRLRDNYRINYIDYEYISSSYNTFVKGMIEQMTTNSNVLFSNIDMNNTNWITGAATNDYSSIVRGYRATRGLSVIIGTGLFYGNDDSTNTTNYYFQTQAYDVNSGLSGIYFPETHQVISKWIEEINYYCLKYKKLDIKSFNDILGKSWNELYKSRRTGNGNEAFWAYLTVLLMFLLLQKMALFDAVWSLKILKLYLMRFHLRFEVSKYDLIVDELSNDIKKYTLFIKNPIEKLRLLYTNGSIDFSRIMDEYIENLSTLKNTKNLNEKFQVYPIFVEMKKRLQIDRIISSLTDMKRIFSELYYMKKYGMSKWRGDIHTYSDAVSDYVPLYIIDSNLKKLFFGVFELYNSNTNVMGMMFDLTNKKDKISFDLVTNNILLLYTSLKSIVRQLRRERIREIKILIGYLRVLELYANIYKKDVPNWDGNLVTSGRNEYRLTQGIGTNVIK